MIRQAEGKKERGVIENILIFSGCYGEKVTDMVTN